MKKTFSIMVTLVLVIALISGCSNAGTAGKPVVSASQVSGPQEKIVFSGSSIEASSEGVMIDGTTVTVVTPGSYILSGALEAGRVVVDCDGDVTLILSGVSITSDDGPAIDIRDANKVTLTLMEQTENAVTDSQTYSSAANGQDAAIFSKADLVINGAGSLMVRANHNDGIASRDTLLIENGDITVNAKKHGIKGKDYLLVTGGQITVAAGGDGIKATNTDQVELGYVKIQGGRLSLEALDDGISAVSHVTIIDGDISIVSENNGIKSENTVDIQSGMVSITYGDDDFVCVSKSISGQAQVTLQQS